MTKRDLTQIISAFGAVTKAKLSNAAATGAPEDQLRAPVEELVIALAEMIGGAIAKPSLVGETQIAELKTRPDYAVTRRRALIGHIELKAPGKGVDPKAFSDPHDRAQWEKLKALPNLLYCDGNGFALFRDGKKVDDAYLVGDVRNAGDKLAATHDLERLIADFLSWQPIPPKTPKKLAETSARLCRLLRDEVREQMEAGSQGLAALHEDIRKLMFPEWTEVEFADGYAQSVTFGLLMARARGISLEEGIGYAAKALKETNTLIGAALGLLTQETEQVRLKTSLETMTRVLSKVKWEEVSRGDPEAWLYFYEDFLNAYDKSLRKKTGSYYTPQEVVEAMVRFTDELLRTRFGQKAGLASHEVKVADPAAGTGTFLLGVLRRIAATVRERQGEGQVAAEIETALSRLIGFELQFGPFAVAQLRLLAEIAELTGTPIGEVRDADLRLHVADTLADPDEGSAWIPSALKEIGESRQRANQIKRSEPITVVIGNPPYKVEAKALAGWIATSKANENVPLDDWKPPTSWGIGAHTKHLHNLYVYFWRWAAWKVFGGKTFGSGKNAITDKFSDERGIVCFITAAGFLNGPGFQKMRAELRRQADEIWVIDCTPEGHQPPVSSRIFEGVQHKICIVIAVKTGKDGEAPAIVRFAELPEGHREREKFAALVSLQLDDDNWQRVSDEPRASFYPAGREEWSGYPGLDDLFSDSYSGCKANRTWPIAPDTDSLSKRWHTLISEKDSERKSVLFKEGRDRHLTKVPGAGISGHAHRNIPVMKEEGPLIDPVAYAFRSFDRQFIIPDKRIIDNERPPLWEAYSVQQLFMTAFTNVSPVNGPAVTFTSLIPDMHHYKGDHGGRAFPLWADAQASQPNVRQSALDRLTESYGREITGPGLFAYIAAIAAHPGYTDRFRTDLRQPGFRIPVTADATLFADAAELGQEVIWLHTFGERFADPAAGRPADAPRAEDGPVYPREGAIPTDPENFPDDMKYYEDERRLHVGRGYFDNVDPRVWAYEVSGMHVLTQWFSYRKKDRSRPLIGDRRPPSPLNDIMPDHWLPDYTSDLIDILHVLTRLVRIEARQDDLLSRIVESPQLTAEFLAQSN